MKSSSVSAKPGTLLAGKYRLVRRIGIGGMGSVWEAVYLPTERRVAVKLLLPQNVTSSKARKRFEREARMVPTIDSDHVVNVYEYGISIAGEPFIVMEYLEGEDLFSVLRREKQLAVPYLVELMVQATRGLTKVHEKGIVHRDLKPRNLFISRRDPGVEVCKILDFGIAKVSTMSGAMTTFGTLVGTLEYMSPEQLRSEPNIDCRTDLYSLGCIMYECLASRRPYQAGEPHALMYRILTSAPQPIEQFRPDLPRGLAAIIHRCLSAQAEQRYQSAAELRAVLEPYRTRLASAPEIASHERSPVVEQSRPQSSQSRRPVWRCALASAVGISALTASVALLRLRAGADSISPEPSASPMRSAETLVVAPGVPAASVNTQNSAPALSAPLTIEPSSGNVQPQPQEPKSAEQTRRSSAGPARKVATSASPSALPALSARSSATADLSEVEAPQPGNVPDLL